MRRLVLTIAGKEDVDPPADDETTIVTRTPKATEAAIRPKRIA